MKFNFEKYHGGNLTRITANIYFLLVLLCQMPSNEYKFLQESEGILCGYSMFLFHFILVRKLKKAKDVPQKGG